LFKGGDNMEPIKVKFNRNMELEIPGLGTFKTGETLMVSNENVANHYIRSGYFDLVKVKEKKKMVKKYKKKGDDKKCH